MKLHKDFLIEELDLPYSSIYNEQVDTSRWSEVREIVFPFEGKFYRTSYSKGLTENQDESPWEYETDVECQEVELVEKIVKVWKAV